MTFPDDYDHPIKCTKCGHKFTERLTRIERELSTACPGCGATMEFTAENIASIRDHIEKYRINLSRHIKIGGK